MNIIDRVKQEKDPQKCFDLIEEELKEIEKRLQELQKGEHGK